MAQILRLCINLSEESTNCNLIARKFFPLKYLDYISIYVRSPKNRNLSLENSFNGAWITYQSMLGVPKKWTYRSNILFSQILRLCINLCEESTKCNLVALKCFPWKYLDCCINLYGESQKCELIAWTFFRWNLDYVLICSKSPKKVDLSCIYSFSANTAIMYQFKWGVHKL